jgi:hypothetical protein
MGALKLLKRMEISYSARNATVLISVMQRGPFVFIEALFVGSCVQLEHCHYVRRDERTEKCKELNEWILALSEKALLCYSAQTLSVQTLTNSAELNTILYSAQTLSVQTLTNFAELSTTLYSAQTLSVQTLTLQS